jgi:hypothetical protein
VRNRFKLVNFRTRYRLQLGAVQDVLFPEFKQFFRARSTGRTARTLLEQFPTLLSWRARLRRSWRRW